MLTCIVCIAIARTHANVYLSKSSYVNLLLHHVSAIA